MPFSRDPKEAIWDRYANLSMHRKAMQRHLDIRARMYPISRTTMNLTPMERMYLLPVVLDQSTIESGIPNNYTAFYHLGRLDEVYIVRKRKKMLTVPFMRYHYREVGYELV